VGSKLHIPALGQGIVLALALGSAPSTQAQGQIALVRDAQGGRLFVNANSRASQVRSEIPAQSTAAKSAEPLSDLKLKPVRQAIRQEAGRARVDPKLVRAIIKVESDGNPRAVSSKGAQGLMQLVPATARRFGVDNPFDPRQNIHGGVTYLRYLLGRFKGNVPLTLAAYNAGEQRVIQNGGIPPIPETQNYVRKVTALYHPTGESSEVETSPEAASPPAVYRFVDSSGVIHFETGENDLPQNVELAEGR
jgi:soluble lytic murein transglycosylase-like protein